MGKWSHLVGKYPDMAPDPKYGDALISAVDSLKGESLEQLANRYNEADARKKDYEAKVSDAEFDREVATRALTKEMERQSLKSVVIAGYTWTPKPDPYPKITDRVAYRAWCEANQAENMALPWQTLSAVTKHALETGDDLPSGIDVEMKRTFHRTKHKE